VRKLWEIPGGIHPPEHKAQSLVRPLVTLPVPPLVVLPVSQHLGAPAEPVVTAGQQVLKGQLLARGKTAVSANVHASTSGTVTAIEDRPLPHPSGLEGLCMVVEPDGADRWIDLHPCEDHARMEPADLLEKIQAAGIAGMGGAGFPTALKLAGSLPIQTLIINGTECEPYITADDVLMQSQAGEVVRGLQLLAFLLQEPSDILIAIEDNKPQAIGAMTRAVAEAGDSRVAVVPLPTIYPSGGERQLVQRLTGQEVPSGKLPAHVGVVCQNVATVVAAYRAVRFGEPLIERITTVTGEAFANQRNVRVRLGTPIQFVLEQHGYDPERASRLVMGGPMMGFRIADPAAPVIKTTNCLLAPSWEEAPPPPPPQACIRCGLCAEACPAGLLPQQLYWYARAQDEDKLKAHHLFDCIECGACTYVCPSHIPLVQFYRAAKGDIRHRETDKQQADLARQRFEFRKQRVAEEKAARASARAEAQAKARQQVQQQASTGNPERTSFPEKEASLGRSALMGSLAPIGKVAPLEAAALSETEAAPQAALADEVSINAAKPNQGTLLANALARAKQSGAPDPRGRLERKLLAANDRLDKLRQKLEAVADSPEQTSALLARIKEAELACQKISDQMAARERGQTP
jgi:Na+-translocating ferredoxin:NAD+ oxidoreductase subunit C